MFGKSEENSAREAEAERLCALPVADLATEIMPVFGPGQPGSEVAIATGNVINYLLESYPGGPKRLSQLERPVREGLQMLEHAGLILVVPTDTYGGVLFVTRLGEKALAEGTVRRYLSDRGPV